MSLRAYATRRGVSVEAISKAVSDGRLKESVVVISGAPKIADPDLADAELDANSRPRIDRAAPAPRDLAEYYTSRSQREATRAEMEALKLAEKRGDLVSAKEVETRLVNAITRSRTLLLAIPGRHKQRHPELTSAHVASLDTLIREALDVLAELHDG